MKLFVLGGSGLIGNAIVKKAKDEFDVLTTYYRNSVAIDNVNSFKCYFPNDLDKLEEVVKKEKPDVIVNTMGYSNIDFCESNKNNTEKLHVETTERICNICESNGSKQIFLSSDYVFDGEKGDYSENDIPNPVNFYGLSKLKAEQLILKNPLNTIIRTSVIYDWDYRARFFNYVIDNLQKQQVVKATTDVYNSITFLDNLVDSMLKVIKLEQNGIFHVVDSTCSNRFEFAKVIAKVFKLDENLVERVSVHDNLKNIAKRPKNAWELVRFS